MMSRTGPTVFFFSALALLALAAGTDPVLAGNPFGIVPPDGGGAASTASRDSLFGWIATQQAAFYRLLVGTLNEMKVDGHAAWLLIGISFLYGVFHASGPGHGKAVITSYLLVSRETVQKGIIIAFAAAMVQGLMAIAIVLAAIFLLGTTALAVTGAANWLEIFSFGIVAVMGAYLLWAKATGRGHLNCHACQTHHNDGSWHARSPGHAPTPSMLTVPFTFTCVWSAVLAVGIRPCSGAIIILVFAMSQQLYGAGLVSVLAMSLGTAITVSALVILTVMAKNAALRYANAGSVVMGRIIHVVELIAAVFVMLLGITLLGGALVGR